MGDTVNITRGDAIKKRRDGQGVAGGVVTAIPVSYPYVNNSSEDEMTADQILLALLDVDGDGSLLDADMLDGCHASAFEPAGTGHTEAAAHVTAHEGAFTHANIHAPGSDNQDLSVYLLLSGGTMTGNLNFTNARILPTTDGMGFLGEDVHRWAGVYAVSGIFDSLAVGENAVWHAGNFDPDDYAVVEHAHGNITNAGAIGSTANLPVITSASGALVAGSFGTDANTFCQGNDGRLSNARTPVAHNLIDTTNHPVSGLTAGHFLKALTSTTYGFAAHGLNAASVGADAAGTGHNEAAAHVTAHEGTYAHANIHAPGSDDQDLSVYLLLSGGIMTGNLNVTNARILPTTDGTGFLGDNVHRWAGVYAVSGIFDSLAVGGNAVWHSGNFDPADYAVVGHNHAETTITFSDVTTGNASVTKHGYVPKLGGGAINFFRADGTWAAPQGDVKGSGSGTRIAFWADANTLGSSHEFLWDGTGLEISQEGAMVTYISPGYIGIADLVHLNPYRGSDFGVNYAYLFDTLSTLGAYKLMSFRIAGVEKVSINSVGLSANYLRAISFVWRYIINDTALISHNTEVYSAATSYTKVKTITLGANVDANSTLRLKFDLRVATAEIYAYGKIYRNGVAIGTEQTTILDTYSTYSEDIAGWYAGDRVELWIKSEGTPFEAYIRNFRICGTHNSAMVNEITGTAS